MATVTAYTAERMKAIEDASIVDGEVVGDNLILTRFDGTPIDAGSVRGPVGPLAGPEYAVEVIAASGAALTLAVSAGHRVTMDQSCTFTFPTPTQDGHTFLLWLAGSFTPTFPASVDWESGLAPTYADDSLYAFTTLDGGTTWLGSLVASGLA